MPKTSNTIDSEEARKTIFCDFSKINDQRDISNRLTIESISSTKLQLDNSRTFCKAFISVPCRVKIVGNI